MINCLYNIKRNYKSILLALFFTLLAAVMAFIAMRYLAVHIKHNGKLNVIILLDMHRHVEFSFIPYLLNIIATTCIEESQNTN